MTDSLDARDAGTRLLEELAAELPSEQGVSVGRMFNGTGLKVEGRFFAFVSNTGQLVVKLPEREVRRLVAEEAATFVTMGKRTMREWASLPQPHDGDSGRWRTMLDAARVFVAALE